MGPPPSPRAPVRALARAFVREPLVLFLLAGAGLFAAWSWLHRGEGRTAGVEPVRVTEQQVAWISQQWERQRLRPPTQDELRGLVTNAVREELLAREAAALGLAEDDTVVRRRLAQKMTFLLQDTSPTETPSDEALARTFETHPDLFTRPPRVSFTHVYFGPPDARARAEKALAGLVAAVSDADVSALGDAWLWDTHLSGVDEAAVARELGSDFARDVFAAPVGAWTGPIASAYGMHLVRVSERLPGGLPALADVRDQVITVWERERREQQEVDVLRRLADKYPLAIDDSVRPLVGDVTQALGDGLAADDALPVVAGSESEAAAAGVGQ